MKKTLILLLACCACIRSQAQTPEAAAAPEPSVTRTDSTLTFPEPEFIGQALAIRPDNRTEQLVQESLAPRHRSSTGQKLFGIGKNHIDEMTLKGAQSPVRLRKSDGIAFIIRVPDNLIDPMSVISVFRFKVKKKMRITHMVKCDQCNGTGADYASVGTFGDQQRNTLERQPFTSRRFGSSSYLIILKGVETGEYGITVDALGSLNVSTFGVDE